MYWLFMLQAIVPAALVCLLACFPLRGSAAYSLQATATLLVLAALALLGIWTIPPWWYPHAWLLVGSAAVVRHVRARRERFIVERRKPWVVALASTVSGVLIVLAAWQLFPALQGRSPRAGDIVELAFPLEAGRYLVVNGGSTAAINAHLRTLDPDFPGFQHWRGQSFGIDIVAIDALGLRAHGIQPSEPRAYRSYGVKVLAPCSGTVLHASDDLPDHLVPLVDRSHMAGNYLLLRCAEHDVVLGHLQTGSLQVAAGQEVVTGQHLAAVGNTGNSDEPHLHIHAQTAGAPAAPMSGTPLQIRLAGRFLLRNQRVLVP
jgi:hypothetical protein